MVFCKLICADVRDGMRTIEDGSIDLVITSPPYNVGKEYEVGVSREEYTEMIFDVCKEFKRVLKPDGRFCCNVPFTMGSHSVTRLVMWEWETALLEAGLTIRDYIVWDQSNSGNDTAWGSWKSASSPWLRHKAEVLLIGYNEQWKKMHKGESSISSRDFTRWTLDIWTMACARSKFHPAVFPEELPRRCIHLFSYVGDVVLDPFSGAGTTLKVARDLRRNSIGIDQSEAYCEESKERIGFCQGTIDNSVKFIYEKINGDEL
ncbi:MAG: site-specific DNA-methyltransferase [Deltaproteobacteria bacterium]|nr:MAG: site-specific DNA-methyltransferase [Deltaproteobacteria bacterium]